MLVLTGAAIDSDGDGIPDDVDKCPADAETYNGYQDTDGCPDVSQPRPGGQVPQLLERVAFAHDSAELKPASFALLDAIAIVVRNQPEAFPTVALEGHAADNERITMKLSLARASTVRLALIARGVDPNRLQARAYGTTAPVCTERRPASLAIWPALTTGRSMAAPCSNTFTPVIVASRPSSK